MPHVSVVPVFWNSEAIGISQLIAFYKALVAPNAYFGLLTEYSVPSLNQTIGFGDSPSAYIASEANYAVLPDSFIQATMSRWFQNNQLAQPNADGSSYYPIHVPRYDLCASVGCGYHTSFQYNGISVLYGVIPECGCASENTPFIDNLQITASHELAEAVTDPEWGAWIGPGGEIGDLCEGTNQWDAVVLGECQ